MATHSLLNYSMLKWRETSEHVVMCLKMFFYKLVHGLGICVHSEYYTITDKRGGACHDLIECKCSCMKLFHPFRWLELGHSEKETTLRIIVENKKYRGFFVIVNIWINALNEDSRRPRSSCREAGACQCQFLAD